MKMENTRKNPRIQMSGIVEAKKADGTASNSDSGMKSWVFDNRFTKLCCRSSSERGSILLVSRTSPTIMQVTSAGSSPEFEDGEPCQRRRVVAAQLGV
jgi:hypothetical protein